MATSVTRQNALATRTSDGRINVSPRSKSDVRNAVVSFLDTATTATGKQTYYNTADEQRKALDTVHEAVFGVNRGLYGAMLCLPGITDYSRQQGVTRLLNEQFGKDTSLLTSEQESRLIEKLVRDLPVHRILNLFGLFREKRVNTNKARKLILRTLLASDRLDWWAVKYRSKMRTALTHAWGVRCTAALRSILSKSRLTVADKDSIRRNIDKWAGDNKLSAAQIRECVSFILDGRISARPKTPLIKAYISAKTDIEKGAILPREVLEGIRSTYHKRVSSGKVLELSKATMTERDKMKVQASAAKQGVRVKFSAKSQDLVSLYVYALERGMDPEVSRGIESKAKDIASLMPFDYDSVSIVVDTSASMFGSDEQKRRPLAVALAMRDVLSASAQDSFVYSTSGNFDDDGLIEPQYETHVAETLVESLREDPDAVFVITDGYENAPAGRTAEVVERLRKMGIDTPIYQVTPVMAAESMGKEGAIRRLAPDIAPMPVTKPEAIGTSMIRAALSNDVENGIEALLSRTVPQLNRVTKGR